MGRGVGVAGCLVCRQGGGILLQVVIGRYVHVLECLPRWRAASPAQRTTWRLGGRRPALPIAAHERGARAA